MEISGKGLFYFDPETLSLIGNQTLSQDKHVFALST